MWDISDPTKVTLAKAYLCRGSQSDVSVYKNLLFVSGEAQTGRVDCGMQGVPEPVSKERLRGIRIFDITDMANPKYVDQRADLPRLAHAYGGHRSEGCGERLHLCVRFVGRAVGRGASGLPRRPRPRIPTRRAFRIEVIKVPLAAPQTAAIVSSPRIFNDLRGAAAPRREPRRHARPRRAPREPQAHRARPVPRQQPAQHPRQKHRQPEHRAAGAPARLARRQPAADAGGPRVPSGPNQCHDITVYPAIGLAGGACGGYGLLLDIKDVANPKRLGAASDENMSFWHSATFNNDGTKILFSDEWGGGSQPRCRDTDKPVWGADALFTLVDNKMTFKSYYKLSAAQTIYENCVAHNGSLIPIPGRDVMMQAWYQGGLSVFDWTDAGAPKEIAYFDRGPMDATKLVMAGSWSAYWWNGQIISSEIARGLDIFELTPSGWLTQNELDAAKTVQVRPAESAGSAEDGLAGQLRARPRLPRSALPIERARGRQDRLGPDQPGERRSTVRRQAQGRPQPGGVCTREGCGGCDGQGQGANPDHRCEGPRGRSALSAAPRSTCLAEGPRALR